MCKYLRPVSGCTRGEWACDTAAAAAAAAAAEDGDGCLGLLTLVLLLANSSLMVWGKSGSKRTPCCNLTNFSDMWKQLYFFLNLEIYIYFFHLIFQKMYKFWQNLTDSLVYIGNFLSFWSFLVLYWQLFLAIFIIKWRFWERINWQHYFLVPKVFFFRRKDLNTHFASCYCSMPRLFLSQFWYFSIFGQT